MREKIGINGIFVLLFLSWTLLTVFMFILYRYQILELVHFLNDASNKNDAYHRYVIRGWGIHVFIWMIGSIGLLLTNRFIREQEKRNKQNVLELAESEERFRTLFDNAPSGIVILEKDGSYQSVNDEFLSIVGWSREELLSKKFSDITYEEDMKNAQICLEKLSNGSSACVYEKRYIKPSNEIVWTSVSASVLKNNNGVPINYVVVVNDIQKRKALEEKLKQKESMLHEAQKIARLGYWEHDLIANKTFCSTELKNILECDSLEHDCQYFEILSSIHPDDQEEFKVGFEATLASTLAHEHDYRLLMKDGRVKYIHQRSIAYRNDQGIAIKIISTIIDITTIRISQEAMIKSQKLESIGILAGGIAHDFNNFLTIILGSASLIRMKLHDKEFINTHAEAIEKAAVAASGISKQLIIFAKGGSPVKKVANINDVISNAVSMSVHGLPVTCNLHLDAQLPRTELDEDKMIQVFSNLAINASQAMPDGGKIVIKTSLHKFLDGEHNPIKTGDYIKVTFADSGIGIDKGMIDKIFDPYFTTKEKGNGIGLFVVYSIIVKHDGYVFVDSIKGEGTTFTIYLPIVNALKPENQERETHGRIAKKKNLNILVMDDDPQVGPIICTLLKALGHTTKLAIHGEEMLTFYQEAMGNGGTFDVCFIDLTVIGGMGGKEAIKHLLRLDSHAKAIICSGYGSDETMANYKNQGFIGCIQKPLRLEKVRELLDSLS
jgi:PAS domain S-box-containing protein